MKILSAYKIFVGHKSNRKADEIGVAMQKASASAEEFGVSFEWLGTYIATVSEKTRQAPEVIGTAINSIMARMHSIKKTGFNEEDATQINDVAKALNTLGIELLDEQNNWRSMSDIMLEIAEQWGTLDNKQKSYISTTMAGTKQQNTFLALMNDMAKGAEGGSRAFELYAGAMSSAGTAAQKYGVYMESVEAAQGRFKASLEELYSLLDANWMKNAYDGMAGFVDLVTRGTEGMRGLNIVIPAATLALGGVAAVIVKIVSIVRELSSAIKAVGAIEGFASILSGGSIGVIVAAVAGVATLVTTIVGALNKASEVKLPDYTEQLSNVKNYVNTISPLVEEYTSLSEKQNKTTSDTKRMDEIFAQLSGTSYSLQTRLQGLEGQYGSNSEAVKAMNDELREQMDLQYAISQMDAFSKFGDQIEKLKDAYAEMESVDVEKNVLDYWNSYKSMLEDPKSATKDGFARYLYSGYNNSSSNASEANAFGDTMDAEDWYARADEYYAAWSYVSDLDSDIAKEMESLNTLIGSRAKEASASISAAWDEIQESLSLFSEDSALLDVPAEVTENIDSFVCAIVDSLRDSVDGNADALTKEMTDKAAALIRTYTDAVKNNLEGANMADVLPDNFKDSLNQYEEELFAFLQKLYKENPAAVTNELLASVAEMFTGCRDTLVEFASSPEFSKLMDEYNELLKAPSEADYDGYKKIVDSINEYISGYNAQVENGEIEGAKIDLLPDFNEEEFAQWQESATAAIENVGDAADDAAKKLSKFEEYYTSWLSKQEASNAAKNGYKDTAADILNQSIDPNSGKFDLTHYKSAMDAAYAANSDLVEGMTEAFPLLADIYNGLMKESDAYAYLQSVMSGTALAYADERAAIAENIKQQEELTRAKENGFAEQVDLLDSLMQGDWKDVGGVSVFVDGIDEARKEFSGWSSDMQESFAEVHPELYKVLAGIQDATGETYTWEQALKLAQDRIKAMSLEEFVSSQQGKYTAPDTKGEARAKTAQRTGFISDMTQMLNIDPDGTDEERLVALRARLKEINEESATYYETLMDNHSGLGIIFDDTTTWADVEKYLAGEIEETNKKLRERGYIVDETTSAYIAKQRAAAETETAEKTGYAKQIGDMIGLYNMAGESDNLNGDAVLMEYIDGLIKKNSELGEGFVETYDCIKQFMLGNKTAAETIEALTALEGNYATAIQKTTEEQLKQNAANKEAEKAKANNYVDQIEAGKAALETGGEKVFQEWWGSLAEDIRTGITDLYPEIAKMATGFDGVKPSIKGIGDELDRVRTTSLKEFTDAINGSDAGDLERVKRLENAYAAGGKEGFNKETLNLFNEDQSGMVAFYQNNRELMALGEGLQNAAKAEDLFTEANYRARYSSIAATEALIKQNEAAEQAEKEKGSNYAGTADKLRELIAAGNNDATLQYWQDLPEDIREGFTAVYPEAAAVVTEINNMTEAATQFGDALQTGLDRLEEAKQSEFFKAQGENAEADRKKQEADTAADNRYSEQFDPLQDVFAGAGDLEDKTASIEELKEKIYEMYSENSTLAEGFRDEYGNFWNVLFSDDSTWEDIVAAYLEALEQCRNSLQETADTLYLAANGTEEYNAAMESIQEALDTGSEEAFIEVWNSLGKAVQEALLDSSDAIKDYVTSLSSVSSAHEDAADTAKKLVREGLAKEGAQLSKQNKIWDETVDVIEDSGKAQADYLKSIGSVGTKLNNLALAQADLATAMDTTKQGTEAYNTALSNLESYCGFAINSEYDLAMAAALLAGDTDMAMTSMEWLINSMLALTGISLDPSTWVAQLQALATQGDFTAQAILDLIDQLAAVNGATVNLNKDGKVVVSNLGTETNGTRRSSRRSSGGGGGGGSRRSTDDTSSDRASSRNTEKIISEIERLLDVMSQIQTIQNFKREIIDLQKAYHESRGEIQGVLKCIEYEKQAIEANSLTLKGNLSQLEALMVAKRAEVNAMSTSAEGYSDAADELKSLQERHMEYSKQLLQNRNDLESLNKEIKEWKNKIRQMEIDLRNLILSAIEDREELKERMLQGTIDTENEIIDIIKARYEKERDEILETTDAKKEALEEEKKALKEQLNARKEAQQEEEKMIELQQMEAKLARITADPTRRKEALALQKKIKDLRDEIAWDNAEKEVEAQQNAIDEQIESTEEYAQYIKDYYEDLLNNPRNFIEEVQRILMQSDEEILNWLKENSEEYKNSTDASRTDIANGWQDMLNDMHGAIVTYWDEVEEIIQRGDDAIIQFLMDNSADYKAAGKLQAEAYVDQWKEQLENLRNAYKDVAVDISSYDYQVVAPPSSSYGSEDYGGGAGGGYNPTGPKYGGGSKPSSGGGKNAVLYKFVFNGSTYSGFQTIAAAKAEAQRAAQAWYERKMKQSGGRSTGTQEYAAMQKMLSAALSSISGYPVGVKGSTGGHSNGSVAKYASGGLNTTTGPAWLDGTPTKPERVLSPYQTELFEDMIQTLHAIKTVNVPSMPAFGADTSSRSQPALTFGDVIIQVDKLDDDTDYDELAEKFFDHVLEKSGRVQSVGGIRLSK